MRQSRGKAFDARHAVSRLIEAAGLGRALGPRVPAAGAVFWGRNLPPVLTFILLIVTFSVGAVSTSSCNLPQYYSDTPGDFSDAHAQTYQMYFDSSSDPALNELQIRRFVGHMRLPDLTALFGEIASLPQDENCNRVGGPILEDGLNWYLRTTPDLVFVNLVSVAADGTSSSATDLDGDRIVDILDVRFGDGRRYSVVSERVGLEAFREFLAGLGSPCDSELARLLGLPDLGCGGADPGASAGGSFFPGTGIIDPLAEFCSQFDTGPGSGLRGGAAQRGPYISPDGARRVDIHATAESYTGDDGHEYVRMVDTYVQTDAASGAVLSITKWIYDYDFSLPGNPLVQVTHESVNAGASEGGRGTQKFNADGTPAGRETVELFAVDPAQVRRGNYDSNETNPPPDRPGESGGGAASSAASSVDGSDVVHDNPGPEGDDSRIADFCRQRANHRSGIEQAVAEDPTSITLSCGEVVDAPSRRNCMIIEWATAGDMQDVMDPPSGEDGCDPFNEAERGCEPATIQDRIRHLRGRVAELWSFETPWLEICPAVVCDPASDIQLQSYSAGDVSFACAAIPETPTLEPSEENCPPGTYFAPASNRCIPIELVTAPPPDSGGGACEPPPGGCDPNTEYFSTVTCSCQELQ